MSCTTGYFHIDTFDQASSIRREELFFRERRDLCVQELSAVSGEIQYSIEIEYSIPRIMEAQFGGLN